MSASSLTSYIWRYMFSSVVNLSNQTSSCRVNVHVYVNIYTRYTYIYLYNIQYNMYIYDILSIYIYICARRSKIQIPIQCSPWLNSKPALFTVLNDTWGWKGEADWCHNFQASGGRSTGEETARDNERHLKHPSLAIGGWESLHEIFMKLILGLVIVILDAKKRGVIMF